MQRSGLSLPFVFVCLLYHLLSFLFHSRLFIWNQHCLGCKVSWFVLLSFPRHASLRDRSPESSEPYVTLDSRSSLNRTTFGVRTSFFPSPHLRVSRTLRIFSGLLEEFCPTDTLCRETRQHVLAFTFRENKVKSFLEIFSSERIRAQSCNKVQNSVLSLQYQYN